MNRLGNKVLGASLSVMLLLAACCGLVVLELGRSDDATAQVMRDYARALAEGEFHEALTRATGETASYVQSGIDHHRQEANGALDRANQALATMRGLAEGRTSLRGDLSHVLRLERQESLLRVTEVKIGKAIDTTAAGGDVDTLALLAEVHSSEEQADALWDATAAGHRKTQVENEQALYDYNQRVRMLVFASVAALAIWVGLLIAYVRLRVVRPLTELADLASTVASGNLSRSVEVTHSDELGQLQQGFNHMVSELAVQQGQLAEMVERLSRARDLAEAASRAKSDFLANVSHEIRTPMNGVVATLDLMHESAPNLEQRDLADMARIAARNLLWMVNDLLDFSRIEAGKLELTWASFDLHELVHQMVGLHVRRGAAKGVAVTCTVATDVPARVLGDPARLGQILQNLLDNAIKFTEHGSIEVALSIDRSEPGAGGSAQAGADLPIWLRIRVTDTGIGIPERSKGAIFQPFEQVGPAGARSHGGIGLGLSIARKLTQLMQGQLGFESTLGQGSSFWFTARLLPDQPRGAPAPSPSPQRRLPAGRRVLLAEDNRPAREVMTRMLERRGLCVTTAENGTQVLAIAAREPLDLILMDCQMPEMDGFEATRAIRALAGALASVPIVALTAYGLVEQRQHYLDAGFDDLVSKPYTVEEIEEVLHRWLVRQV